MHAQGKVPCDSQMGECKWHCQTFVCFNQCVKYATATGNEKGEGKSVACIFPRFPLSTWLLSFFPIFPHSFCPVLHADFHRLQFASHCRLCGWHPLCETIDSARLKTARRMLNPEGFLRPRSWFVYCAAWICTHWLSVSWLDTMGLPRKKCVNINEKVLQTTSTEIPLLAKIITKSRE